jgi:hypothetical protein
MLIEEWVNGTPNLDLKICVLQNFDPFKFRIFENIWKLKIRFFAGNGRTMDHVDQVEWSDSVERKELTNWWLPLLISYDVRRFCEVSKCRRTVDLRGRRRRPTAREDWATPQMAALAAVTLKL